ncbi:Pentapeptide repeat [Trinorchestia longiramus]|nr:Pentapeptide repeat [Trinorchestia longiramus]
MASVENFNQLPTSSSVGAQNSVVHTAGNAPRVPPSVGSNAVLNPCQSLLHIPVVLNYQCCLHSPSKPQNLDDMQPIVCQPAHVYVNKLAHPECVLSQPSGDGHGRNENLENGEIAEMMSEATYNDTSQNAKCVLRKKGRALGNVGIKRHSYPVSLLNSSSFCQNCHSSDVSASLLTCGADACINSSVLKSSLYSRTSLQDYSGGENDASLDRICVCDKDVNQKQPSFHFEATDCQKHVPLTKTPLRDVQTQTEDRSLSNGKGLIANAAHEELCMMAKKLIKFQILSDTSTFTDLSFVSHKNTNQNANKTLSYLNKEDEKTLENSFELTKKRDIIQSLEASTAKIHESAERNNIAVNHEESSQKTVAGKTVPAKQSSLLSHLQCHMPQSPILSHRVGLPVLDASNVPESLSKSRAVLEDIREGSEKSSSVMSKSSDETSFNSKANTHTFSCQSLHDSFSSLHASDKPMPDGTGVQSATAVSSSATPVCPDGNTISKSNFNCTGEKSKVFGDTTNVFENYPVAKLSSSSKNYDICPGLTTSASSGETLPLSCCYTRSFMEQKYDKTSKSNEELNSVVLSANLKHDPSLISALPALQALTKLVDSSMTEAHLPETSRASSLTAEESYDLETRRYSQLMGLTQSKLDDWIQLNVGGELFVTSRATLILEEPDSMLAKMFGGHHPHLSPASLDPQGRYIIDRSPRYFAPLLNYLRTGALVLDSGVNPEGAVQCCVWCCAVLCLVLCSVVCHAVQCCVWCCAVLCLVLCSGVSGAVQWCVWCCAVVCLVLCSVVSGVLLEAKFYGLEGVIPHLERLVAAVMQDPSDKPLTRHDVVGALLTTPPSAPLRFQAVNLSGADLSWLDLSNINFKYADLRGADLTGANMSNCNLERAKLAGARLEQALLLNVRMVCADLRDVSMKRCVFENPSGGTPPNLEGSVSYGVPGSGVSYDVPVVFCAVFRGSGVSYTVPSSSVTYAVPGSGVTYAVPGSGVNLRNSDLEGSMMAHVNLRVSTLKNANLRNCDLRMSVLAGADLENCDLSGSNLLNANLRGANLKNASFELMQTPLHMSQTCDL